MYENASLHNRILPLMNGLMVVTLLISACKKGSDIPPNSATDVYMAGIRTNTATAELSAVYWKNGIQTKLSSSPDFSEATGIAVSGNNVYVSGNLNGSAVYWKNGTVVPLNGGNNAAVYAITVSGNDVFLAGAVFSPLAKAAYWKNNVLITLDNNLSYANAITVAGNEVIVAGTVGSGAVYWINGNIKTLTAKGKAVCVTVSDTNIYVGGTREYSNGKSVATYWKNGVEVALADTLINSSVSNIVVSGNKVYVSGTLSQPGYWINNNFFYLPQGALPKESYIAVNGNDIYLATNLIDAKGAYLPVYYKNGEQAPTPDLNPVNVFSYVHALTVSK
jgi:hypothetical protein